MPSPFPGMDPYLEGQTWSSFHNGFINTLADLLVPQLRPRYVAAVEEHVWVETHAEAPLRRIRPDVTFVDQAPWQPGAAERIAVLDAPAMVPISTPQEETQPFLEIRFTRTTDVVAVLEFLSPANKGPSGSLHEQYLAKRGLILNSSAHLVEIDLLRGGNRLPADHPLPEGDFFVVVSDARLRPNAGVWPIRLEDPLPRIPVPLAASGEVAWLDLQQAFTQVYDRRGYDYSLDYRHGPRPPLEPERQAWATRLLAAAGYPT